VKATLETPCMDPWSSISGVESTTHAG